MQKPPAQNHCAFAVAAVIALFGANAEAGSAYNKSAGQSAPAAATSYEEIKGDDGRVQRVERDVAGPVKKDHFGNAQGNQYDLAVDGAFEGQTVAVLHFYTGEGFDFALPRAALKEKGFSVFRWVNAPPPPAELEEKLKKASQLWIISSSDRRLNDEHVAVIKRLFDSGRGVYIWGDNEPYYADANVVGKALLGVEMRGNLHGGQPVPLQKTANQVGVRPNHLLSTGIETVYEGITIATIDTNQTLTPIIWGSAHNVVTSAYEKDGKRALFDGGFTRLFLGWETAGTARYVKNAAAWLTNVERFGDAVTADASKTPVTTPVKK
ncbi:MAG: hypothetical protein Q8O67_00805 [Deltaproteobacteria bacterium]|nr:hypothetical protein [Deltaproteobacteria bacterium]